MIARPILPRIDCDERSHLANRLRGRVLHFAKCGIIRLRESWIRLTRSNEARAEVSLPRADVGEDSGDVEVEFGREIFAGAANFGDDWVFPHSFILPLRFILLIHVIPPFNYDPIAVCE